MSSPQARREDVSISHSIVCVASVGWVCAADALQ